MFRGRNALVASQPRDGEAVEVLAQVTLYEPRGEFQLGVESLQRAGVGRLYEQFVRLRDRLAAAGLFDAAVKRALPRFPRSIAVVTSLQAAALRDVLAALQRRAPYLRVTVHAAPVQGEGAGARLAAALAGASARGDADVVLLVRGGGSLEDLWAFNEEVLARAIRASVVPVVTGVGHESDITIADLAADLRAPTPTAAAELVAPARRDLLDATRCRRATPGTSCACGAWNGASSGSTTRNGQPLCRAAGCVPQRRASPASHFGSAWASSGHGIRHGRAMTCWRSAPARSGGCRTGVVRTWRCASSACGSRRHSAWRSGRRACSASRRRSSISIRSACWNAATRSCSTRSAVP